MGIIELRVVERILAVLIGGICIYLGYRLFTKLPEAHDSAGRIVLPGNISVIFSRIGPGAFFCLFGAGVVALSLYHGLQVEMLGSTEDSGKREKTVTKTAYRYMSEPSNPKTVLEPLRSDARRTVADLNAIESLVLPGLPDKRQTDIRQALRESKLAVIERVWGPDWGDFDVFQTWVNDGASDSVPLEEKSKVPAQIFRQRGE
jgi:hypothetical protein